MEKLRNKKNVQSSYLVENDNSDKYANVNVITRKGTNTKIVDISKHKGNMHIHPDATLQRETFKDASHTFEELSQDDIQTDNHTKTVKELIQLITKEEAVGKLIDLLYSVKKSTTSGQSQKTVCSMGKHAQPDLDPKVNLVVNGYTMPQVVVDFGSQVNILPRSTWVKLGRP